MKHNRNGFALLYAILVSAVIFISIVEVLTRIVPEKVISNNRIYSQQAVSCARNGINQIAFDLKRFGTNIGYRNQFDPSMDIEAGSYNYLKEQDIIDLINASDGAVFEFQYSRPTQLNSNADIYSVYKVKIRVNENDTFNSLLNISVYSLGEIKYNDRILATSAVESDLKVAYNIYTQVANTWVSTEKADMFNYAVFSGGDIYFADNACIYTYNGFASNIHATGSVYLGDDYSKTRVNGNVESEKSIFGAGNIVGDRITSASPIAFFDLDTASYEYLANAFKTGSAPYDGSNPNFPNTSSHYVQSVICSYLNNPNISPDLSGIMNFYNDFKNQALPLSSEDLVLMNLNYYTAKNIVYFIDNDVSINSDFNAIGTVVINGNLTIDGTVHIGDPTAIDAISILVKKNVIENDNNIFMYGLLYSNGNMKVGANFHCIGCIASHDSISLHGDVTIEFYTVSNNNLGIIKAGNTSTVYNPGDTDIYYMVLSVVDNGSSNGSSSYSWREISYDDFENVR